MVPSEGHNDIIEAAGGQVADTGIFSGVDEGVDSKILINLIKIRRSGQLNDAEVEGYIEKLPQRLREKGFALIAKHYSDDQESSLANRECLLSISAFLRTPEVIAESIINVCEIMARNIC